MFGRDPSLFLATTAVVLEKSRMGTDLPLKACLLARSSRGRAPRIPLHTQVPCNVNIESIFFFFRTSVFFSLWKVERVA